MRRRNLLGESSKYIFSAETTSLSVAASAKTYTVNIISTNDGNNIGYVYSTSGAVISTVTTSSTKITISCSKNPNTTERTASIILTQNESNKKITINVTQAKKEVYTSSTYTTKSTTASSVSFGDIYTSTSYPSIADVCYLMTITATCKYLDSTYTSTTYTNGDKSTTGPTITTAKTSTSSTTLNLTCYIVSQICEGECTVGKIFSYSDYTPLYFSVDWAASGIISGGHYKGTIKKVEIGTSCYSSNVATKSVSQTIDFYENLSGYQPCCPLD